MSHRVAVDVGSSTVKLHVCSYSGDELAFEEVHRFDTATTWDDDRHVWNVEALLENVRRGLRHAEERYGSVDSVGIDATAGDFGLLADGELLQDPYFYRDPAVWSTMDEVADRISERESFHLTGYNGVAGPIHYQHQQHPKLFERADTLVPLPQLLSFELGGRACSETSFATTLRTFDIRSRTWVTDIFDVLGLSTDVLPPVEPAGTTVGTVDSFGSQPEIVLPPSHDTASAVGALPLTAENNAFLATGSWFIPGLELDQPVVTDEAYRAGASNEMGVAGTVRFLHNLPGFSLLEHCRDRWKDEGRTYEYDRLLDSAAALEPDGPLVDVDDDLFMAAQFEGDVESKIRTYCGRTDQPIPESEAEVANCLLVSLAARSALALETLLSVADQTVDRVHLGGGGARNELFCRLFASAVDRPVYAGPTEATALGNVLAQLRAADDIAGVDAGRTLVEQTFDIAKYLPTDRAAWQSIRERMRGLDG